MRRIDVKYLPVIFSLLPVAAGAVTVEELALEPDSPGWVVQVEELGVAELLEGVERITDDASLSAGERLDRLSRFAELEVGVDALLRVPGDGLPLLALAEGLPENLVHLIERYPVVDDDIRERLLVTIYLGMDAVRPALRIYAGGSDELAPPAACILYDLVGEVHPASLVRALSLEGRPSMVAVLGLESAGEEVYPLLISAIRERRPGAISYAPAIFSAGGQYGVNHLDDYLESPDLEVRRVAILVISKFTGKDYSYMMDYEAEAGDYIREGLPVPPELLDD